MRRPTVSIILDIRRTKKDGKYPVKLRLTYLRTQRYWFLGLDLTKEEFAQATAKRPKKAFLSIADKISDGKRKADNIIREMDQFSFYHFETKFLGGSNDIKNVYSFFEDYIKELNSEKRVGTASSYQCSLNSLKAFRPKLGFKEIDKAFLKSYESWMIGSENSITTVGIYLRCLRAIFNKVINEGLLPREYYPFLKHKYVIPAAKNIKKALTLDEVKKIFEYPVVPGTSMDFAKDIWLFSYLCNGMNIKDIAHLTESNVDGENLQFVRAKTARSTRSSQAPISVFLPEHALNIMNKWRNVGAKPDDYLFPILTPGADAAKQRSTVQQAVKRINKYVKRIAAEAGINKNVTSYYARHSYATILKKSGVSIEYISESLGHQNISTTRSYLDSFENDVKKRAAVHLLKFQ